MADFKEFDAEGFVKSKLGEDAKITAINPDGTAKVSLADGTSKSFDINGFIKSKNVDPASVKISYNSPATASDENELGFVDQLKMITAKTPEQKKGFLERQFGKDNVVSEGDSFKVKSKDGLWKKADTAWYNEIAAQSPVMAASIAGAAKGAAAGAAAGPWGATIGGITGGAVSAAIAQYGVQKGAESLGIRTEQDAKTTQDELGRDLANNLIWDTATLGAGKVLKTLNPLNKAKIANVLGGLVNGTKPDDWLQVMKDSSTAKYIRELASKDMTAKSAGELTGDALPSAKVMTKILSDNIQSAKRSAESGYGTALSKLEAVGGLKAVGDSVSEFKNTLAGSLKELGLINVDSSGNILRKKGAEIARDSMVSEKNGISKLMNTLSKVEQLDALQKSGKSVSTKDFLDLKRKVQGDLRVLTNSLDPAERSPVAVRVLSQASEQADNLLTTSMNKISKPIDGIKAGDFLKEANQKYAKYTEAYDFITNKLGDFTDTTAATKLASKMTTDDGHLLIQAFKQLGGDELAINNLRGAVAAKNLASNYGGSGISGAIRSATGMTSSGLGKAAASATEFSPVPKAVLSPIVVPVAKTSEFIRKMSPNDKVAALTNNDIVSQLLQNITDYTPIQQQTEQDLMNKVP